MNRHTLLMAALLATSATASHAGAVTNGSWQPSGCGDKPAAVQLDLRNETTFNKSVDAANAYRKAIRPYLDCVIKEANADIQATTKQANAIQAAAREADDKIEADAKAAAEKFK